MAKRVECVLRTCADHVDDHLSFDLVRARVQLLTDKCVRERISKKEHIIVVRLYVPALWPSGCRGGTYKVGCREIPCTMWRWNCNSIR